MPTPRPTIAPMTVAQAGMSTTYATSDSEPAPTASPSSAVPIGRPIATTEPKATSRITTAASRPRASPSPAGGCSKAKCRSPPASICSDVCSAQVVEERLEALQVAGRQVLPLGVLHPDEGDLPVGRHDAGVDRRLRALGEDAGRVTGAQHVRQRGDGRLDLSDLGAGLGRVEEALAVVDGGQHHVGAQPHVVVPGLGQQLGWPRASRVRGPRRGPRARVRTLPRRR